MKNSKTSNPTQFTTGTDPYLLTQTLQNAHGKVAYNMTNDYMFRAVLQSNNKVLRGLICSLLHLNEADVRAVEITNPIILGEAITDKEIRLDINIRLNNSALINLEMQITNKLNWQNRSLLYLSRSFDRLNRGQDYLDVQPAIHIGFLDYTLFQDHPEFYATYKLSNMKNHHIYSDNFVLSVVDLSRIDLATEEDKKYQIDAWARLFKATTWEEIKNMADTNEYLQEASKSIFQFNTDEQIRKLCRDRIEYHQDLRNYERAIAQRDSEITKLQHTIAEQDTVINSLQDTIAEQNNAITEQNTRIIQQNDQITLQSKKLAEQNDQLALQSETLAQQAAKVKEQSSLIDTLQANVDKLFTLVQQPLN